ncbi:hypothetical protein ANANG_G00006370 [Anguilla anguilla]|uniref:TNFR-Cys domain-containing protein n=1 Tax=Anguilla anguilla TaxID=7936 RepID=A0A9D3MYZ2_ANGAN|nr:hypothetical protein ANANG_G00006370 [Anguilla anguilla]
MRSMTGVFLTLFLSPLFSLYHSLHCDSETEYSSDGKCCSKCKPGERLDKVCTPTSPTKCVPCRGGYYSDRYDEARNCHRCSDCSMIRKYMRSCCTTTHNAVCGCERGYQCKSEPCLDCEKITTPDAGKDTTTTKEVSTAPGVKPVKEGPSSSMWSTHIVLIVCCCTLLIFVILISRNKNELRWIWRTTKGQFKFFLAICKNATQQY